MNRVPGSKEAVRIVFHGENASAFHEGFASLLHIDSEITVLNEGLRNPSARAAYAAADVIIGWRFDNTFPWPAGLKLFHVPGAGYDALHIDLLPASAVVCNCFGHEQAISEYVMAALLQRQVPLADADRRLRNGEWPYRAGVPGNAHGELAGQTIGIVGFGHIGKAIAARAKAFEMQVHVANRSAVEASPLVDRAFRLDELDAFWPSADFIVMAVPLAAETRGLAGPAAFAAMRPTAVLLNVGRGAIVDERALFEALQSGRIAGAVIDTWYQYPSVASPVVHPSELPFHELPNVVLTPHMSGWTRGTIRRRQQAIAGNIERCLRGEPCVNVVRPAQPDRTRTAGDPIA